MANVFDQFDQPVTSGAKDLAVSFAQGANGLLKAVGDIYGLTTGNMENVVSKQAQENIDYLQRQKSPEMLAQEQTRRAAVDAEKDPLDKAWAYVRNTAPEWRLLFGDIAAAAPSVIGSGGVGAATRMVSSKLLGMGAAAAARAGTGAAIAAGAGAQGAGSGAEQYAEMVKTLREMPEETAKQIPQIARLMTEKKATLDEAMTALALDLARKTGAVSGLASAATMLIPGSMAPEKALIGGAARQAGKGILMPAAKAAAGEAAQETAENVSAEVAKNVLARPVEPERPISRGVGEAIGSSILPSAVMGGLGGASMRAEPTKPLSRLVQEGEPTAGIPVEPPAPAATREKLTETPQVDLTKVENLTENQFWAAVDARQAMQTGVEVPETQRGIVGEAKMTPTQVEPGIAKDAMDGVNATIEEWRKENPGAQDVEVTAVFDPDMLHNGYGIRGAYNRDSRAVLLNAAFLQDPDMVKQVLNHEWAHHTLDTEEGRAALQDFARRSLPEGELDALAKQYNTNDPLVLVDEWIAKNQEAAPGVLARMVNFVREWLAKAGIVDLDHDEVARILLRTLRQEANGRVDPVTEREPTKAAVESPDLGQETYETFSAERNSTKDARFALTKLPMAGDLRESDGTLKYTLPQDKLTVSHFSTVPDLEVIDPEYMGKGGAGKGYHRMMKGENKSFFFVGNSKPARAENIAGTNRYTTTIDSSRIYDMDADPLNLWSAINPAKSEGLLKQAGYDGFYAQTNDGRKFVALFYPTDIRTGEIARTEQPLPEPMGEKPRHKTKADREYEAWQKKLESGEPLYSLTQTRTPEFQQWFADSKVVDGEGNPLVVYHGTRDPGFNIFRTTSGHNYGPGAYFTPDAEQASNYSGARSAMNRANEGASVAEIESKLPKNRTPAVYSAYLSIKNPIDAYEFTSLPGTTNIEKNAEARRLGYDGVIKKWRNGTVLEYVAFYPEQVKSATGNVGAYGQRPVTAEEARRMEMTEQEAAEAQKQGDIRMSLTAERGASGLMASPSIEDIQYDRAKRNLSSANQARFKSQITEYAPGASVYDAVGDWADGAENSVAAIFDGVKSADELRRIAAKAGLAGDQKAVLWWATDPNGADAIHRIRWPKSVTMDEARQALIDVGLENRTLIQTPEGIEGFVFDQGQQNINKIEALHDHETDPSFESHAATGEFLGSWTSRTEGRRAYRNVLGSPAEVVEGEGGRGREGGAGGEPETRYSLTRDQIAAVDDKRIHELDIPALVENGILTNRYSSFLESLRETSPRSPRIEVVPPESLPPKAAGLYDSYDDVIRVSSGTKTDLGRIILHEYVHALTIHGLQYADDVYTSRGDVLSAEPREGVSIRELRDASRKMDKLFAEAQRVASESDEKFYGLTNREEFVAEAFSNQRFQQFLSSIPATGTGSNQSLFDKFVSVVKQILGVGDESLLTEVISATQPLVGAKKKSMGTLVAENVNLPEDVRYSLTPEEQADFPLRMGTSNPTAVSSTESGHTHDTVVDLERMRRDPDLVAKAERAIRNTFPYLKPGDDPIGTLVQHVKDNLLFLHDRVPPEIREKTKRWYDGARKLTLEWAERYNLPKEVVTGVLAALSPQKDWFQNIALAERVIDTFRNPPNGGMMSDEMDGVLSGWVIRSKEKFKDKALSDATRRAIEDSLIKMRSTPFEDLDTFEQALWVRAYSEAHLPKSYATYSPEGEPMEFASTKKGEKRQLAWSGFNSELSAALSILKDQSRENISAQLGDEHKVRNFFNNILLPNDPRFGDVTIDTHAVAAGLLKPLSGTDKEVAQNFGSSGGSSVIGISGLYPVYAEAYREAAKERNLLPREMQSITWEAVRGLFPAEAKKGFKSKVNAIWNDYADGKLTLAETRSAIEETAGGIRIPEWLRPDRGVSEEKRAPRDIRQLPRSEPTRLARELRSGTGGYPAPGTEGRVVSEEPLRGYLPPSARGGKPESTNRLPLAR